MNFLKRFSVCALIFYQASPSSASNSSCRALPGDSEWPTSSKWKALNATVGGRLIATIPLGSPCHDPVYNETECAVLQAGWLWPQAHFPSSSSVMAPFFANQSCDPWTAKSRPCLLGNYVSYAVNVTVPSDIAAAVQFAQANNIRFVIRNTGHDYQGRSTGAGALSVWMHHLKDIEILDWSDSNYEGKAIKMGAGVQAYEAMAAARDVGLVTIGGECSTVGIVGGYTQGGGHSALSTTFGLGADQTLSWQVVTANGTLVTASRDENPDLYWAMSGGGPGTYGVAVSLIAKVYPASIVGGASISFVLSETVSADLFYAGVEAYHAHLEAILDAGSTIVSFITNISFNLAAATFYGKNATQVASVLQPFLRSLDDLGIPYSANFSTSPTYYDHYDTYFGPLPYGFLEISTSQYGGRLIPRSTLQNDLSAFSAVVRNITENGIIFTGIAIDVSSHSPTSPSTNAVLPAWRTSLIHAILGSPWNFTAPWAAMVEQQQLMTHDYEAQLQAVTGVSGVYMNEADFQQPAWKEELFGENYAALQGIKQKWDPSGLFYALQTVGSDAWRVAADGRMCRV